MGGAPDFASGADFHFFETIESTSLQSRRLFDDGGRGPLWVMAWEQTAGYGRRGTGWSHGAGNLAATFLFSPSQETNKLPQLSFVAALALSDTLFAYSNHGSVSVKWPNDVLVDGKKIAGLLLELYGSGGDISVAIGCGVNLVSHPNDTETPSCDLKQSCDAIPEPLAFLKKLDACFMALVEQWLDRGFEPIRLAWLDRAHGLGNRVTIRLKESEAEGIFRDISAEGALILETRHGTQTFSGGAVLYQGGP